MTVKLSTTARNNRITVIKTLLDAGSTAGSVKFYTEPMPSACEAITTQTLIATCILSKPCGTASGGTLTFDTIADDIVIDNTGIIAFGRFLDSDNNVVADIDAGMLVIVDGTPTLQPAGAGIIFNQTHAIAGGVAHVISAVLTDNN